ncbi:hypothetical protein [Telluribacter sp. SYSU D00476]|uniref:hypothetical protein n=1 Tax=Telluribacter sp. SYSU D00476 TaxID=2811430 RepID=UPI001FF2A23C|nr:hypothetical protein [Telluribacter sp. SYSU D00476]
MIREFNITVLGPARAGKTSLLSSIYCQFSQVIGRDSDLEITPVSETDSNLGRHAAQLRTAFDTITQMPLNNADVVEATSIVESNSITKPKERFDLGQKFKNNRGSISKFGFNDIEYRFNLGQKNKKPKVQLVLRDYPGEQLMENPKEVIRRIRECSVTMIAIDTPALMVEGGRSFPWLYHNDRNIPENGKNGSAGMLNIFKEAYKDLNEKKMVLLVPVKCEKWMSDPATASLLLDRLKTGYSQLLDFFASEGMSDNVAVVVTPVETMGNIVYAYMDNKENYSPRFMKGSVVSKFNPRYCDQPLRYILRFILKRFLENQGFWFDWFGNDKPFLKAINDFARGCNSDPNTGLQTNGFTTIQGAQLL